jgi:hypothetical protein
MIEMIKKCSIFNLPLFDDLKTTFRDKFREFRAKINWDLSAVNPNVIHGKTTPHSKEFKTLQEFGNLTLAEYEDIYNDIARHHNKMADFHLKKAIENQEKGLEVKALYCVHKSEKAREDNSKLDKKRSYRGMNNKPVYVRECPTLMRVENNPFLSDQYLKKVFAEQRAEMRAHGVNNRSDAVLKRGEISYVLKAGNEAFYFRRVFLSPNGNLYCEHHHIECDLILASVLPIQNEEITVDFLKQTDLDIANNDLDLENIDERIKICRPIISGGRKKVSTSDFGITLMGYIANAFHPFSLTLYEPHDFVVCPPFIARGFDANIYQKILKDAYERLVHWNSWSKIKQYNVILRFQKHWIYFVTSRTEKKFTF